jgi:hypothetical protein
LWRNSVGVAPAFGTETSGGSDLVTLLFAHVDTHGTHRVAWSDYVTLIDCLAAGSAVNVCCACDHRAAGSLSDRLRLAIDVVSRSRALTASNGAALIDARTLTAAIDFVWRQVHCVVRFRLRAPLTLTAACQGVWIRWRRCARALAAGVRGDGMRAAARTGWHGRRRPYEVRVVVRASRMSVTEHDLRWSDIESHVVPLLEAPWYALSHAISRV